MYTAMPMSWRGRAYGGVHFVQGDVEEQDVDAQDAEKAPLGTFSEFLHQGGQLVNTKAAGGGDAGDLQARRFRG